MLCHQIFSRDHISFEALFMEIIKIFFSCGMKQSLCSILKKTMSPMGLPAILKYRCKGLQA